MGDAEIGERVDNRVDDDAKRRGDPAFPSATEPQWMGGRRYLAQRGGEEWHVGRAGHRVIHKRAGEELAGRGIVDALLKQGLAGALRDPAMRLAVQDQRVDGATDIVDRRVAGDFDTPGLGIDFNLADVKAMWEGGDLTIHLTGAGERAAQLLGQTVI